MACRLESQTDRNESALPFFNKRFAEFHCRLMHPFAPIKKGQSAVGEILKRIATVASAVLVYPVLWLASALETPRSWKPQLKKEITQELSLWKSAMGVFPSDQVRLFFAAKASQAETCRGDWISKTEEVNNTWNAVEAALLKYVDDNQSKQVPVIEYEVCVLGKSRAEGGLEMVAFQRFSRSTSDKSGHIGALDQDLKESVSKQLKENTVFKHIKFPSQIWNKRGDFKK